MRTLMLLIVLLISSLDSAMANLMLTNTNESLEFVTTTAASTDYVISYADHTSTTMAPGSAQGNISSGTTTTVLASPGPSTQRQVRMLRATNASASTYQSIKIQKDVGGSNYVVAPTSTLAPGEGLQIDSEGKLTLLDNNGREKQSASFVNGVTGYSLPFYKSGTASDAASVSYGFAKDGGSPGAWTVVPQTTVNGAITDCSIYGDNSGTIEAGFMGAHIIPNPVSGSLYISNVSLASSVANLTRLIDVVWYGTLANITVTTNQVIPSFPASLPNRDRNGSSNGEGYQIGMYWSVVGGSAGVISNSTVTYTNQNGVSGRTATLDANAMVAIPATPVAGTFVVFKLAQGDTGVRSIQSYTLGTSLVSGTIHLMVFRPLVDVPNPVANVGGAMALTGSGEPPGVKIFGGTCMWPIYLSSTTTATVTTGSVQITER